MPSRLVNAYHRCWTGYGHWLPNDPRGSGSTVLLKDSIATLGEIHLGRKHVQPPRQVVRKFYQEAQHRLSYSLLKFDQNEIQHPGDAFVSIIDERKYIGYACAIMQDHVHILIRKHRVIGEEMIEHLQDRSRDGVGEAV